MRYLEGISLDALARGNRRLLTAVKSTGVTVTWKHVAGTAGAVAFFWSTVGKWVPPVLTTTVTVWVVAAFAVGQPGERADSSPAGRPGEEDEEDEDDFLQDAPALGHLVALVRHVAGLSDQGTAAHLDDVLTEGQSRGLFNGWEKADLKDHLSEVGAPLVDSKKLTFAGRQRVRMAVLLDGLPAAEPAPVPAPVPGPASGGA